MESNLRVLNHVLQNLPAWVLPVLVFMAAISFCYGIFVILNAFQKKLTPEELKKLELEAAELETVEKLTVTDKRNGFDRWFALVLEESDSRLSPGLAATIVMGFMLIAGGTAFVFSENVPLSVGAGLIFMVFPMAFWLIRRSWRIGKMRRFLPETLEAIGDAIRGGLNLEDAIEMASQQIDEPLKAEFEYANRQLAMGQTPRLVMDRMAHRIPIPEFRIFTTAVLVHRTTGGNLAQLAERLARSARDRSEFQGHLNAISAGSRMSIGGLVVVTFLAILILCGLDTTYIYKFLVNPYGPTLFGISIALFLIGGFWAWNIMRVKY